MFGKLTALIDAVRPDYLKWDNNFWIDCDRFGHGHGASDGNTAHVRGLSDVLAAIRPRYLSQPLITSSHFKREPDGTKWMPRPCE